MKEILMKKMISINNYNSINSTNNTIQIKFKIKNINSNSFCKKNK